MGLLKSDSVTVTPPIPEFSIANEDFPALPDKPLGGTGASSSLVSSPQAGSSSSVYDAYSHSFTVSEVVAAPKQQSSNNFNSNNRFAAVSPKPLGPPPTGHRTPNRAERSAASAAAVPQTPPQTTAQMMPIGHGSKKIILSNSKSIGKYWYTPRSPIGTPSRRGESGGSGSASAGKQQYPPMASTMLKDDYGLAALFRNFRSSAFAKSSVFSVGIDIGQVNIDLNDKE